MLTLWRLVKRSIVFRLLYRLVCWINYPTPRERMWHMYFCGKVQGRIETLKELPITKVQPKQEAQITEQLHLPTGQWMREWLATHPDRRAAIPSQPAYWPAPFEEHAWLNSKPPIAIERMTPAEIEKVDTKKNLLESTEAMPAVVALLHQEREQRRHVG